jgi:hypothetical protein
MSYAESDQKRLSWKNQVEFGGVHCMVSSAGVQISWLVPENPS